MIKVLIGTSNKTKTTTTKEVFQEILGKQCSIIPHNVSSGVASAPTEENILVGARNRIENLKKLAQPVDYLVALESGLIEKYDQMFEECLCLIEKQDAEQQMIGISSSLILPKIVTKRMKKKPHNLVMQEIREEYGLTELHKDTWGTYTAKKIDRATSFYEAIRNALVPTLQDNLY